MQRLCQPLEQRRQRQESAILSDGYYISRRIYADSERGWLEIDWEKITHHCL